MRTLKNLLKRVLPPRVLAPLSQIVSFLRRVPRILRPMRREYRSRFRMRLRDWCIYHQTHVHTTRCYWMGVKALKNPCDAWIYQEIIYEVKPEIIIEIGSLVGGGTLFLAHMLDLVGRGAVISIDMDREHFIAQHPRIIQVTGHSSSPEVVARVADLCRDKSVLVIHDGGHDKAQVLRDMRTYGPLVSRNSYLIIEDGIVDLFTPGDGIGEDYEGPLTAIDEFMTEHSDFEVDLDRERYILTYNPRGYLRRVR